MQVMHRAISSLRIRAAANYNLHNGDLVALIDIAQETNHQFIRHPVEEGNPDNIPAGSTFNRPNPANTRFYPDKQLSGQPVTNPGTSRTPASATSRSIRTTPMTRAQGIPPRTTARAS
jgi:hypothetical protein